MSKSKVTFVLVDPCRCCYAKPCKSYGNVCEDCWLRVAQERLGGKDRNLTAQRPRRIHRRGEYQS